MVLVKTVVVVCGILERSDGDMAVALARFGARSMLVAHAAAASCAWSLLLGRLAPTRRERLEALVRWRKARFATDGRRRRYERVGGDDRGDLGLVEIANRELGFRERVQRLAVLLKEDKRPGYRPG